MDILHYIHHLHYFIYGDIMGIPWSHITPEEMERNRMYNYRDLSKEENEDVYNEKIIYCKIHHISGIDG